MSASLTAPRWRVVALVGILLALGALQWLLTEPAQSPPAAAQGHPRPPSR